MSAPARPVVRLKIHEIYRSIQGESSHAGRPCSFVRLTGCQMRCVWCDSEHAFYQGSWRSLDEIVVAVAALGCPLVEVTGGEPLLQPDVYPLMDALLAGGRTVLLETGGHVSIERVPAAVVKVVDVKCPASGESHRNHWRNLDLLAPHDEVKFVVQDRGDYEFAREIVRRHLLDRKCAAVLFSPVHGRLDLRALAEWVLADELPVRIQVQLHKYIWGAEVRGV